MADVRKRLFEVYNTYELDNAKAFGLKTFGPELKEKMNYYNKNPILANDKTEALLKDLNGLKDVMVENLSKLLERDGKIEIIASKAEQLSTTSTTYRKNANKARIKMRNRRIFMIAMGVVIAGLIAFFIAAMVCGGFSFSSCRS